MTTAIESTLFDHLFLTEHRHAFELWQGPIQVQAQAGTSDAMWCWTCGSWTNRAGVSMGQTRVTDAPVLARHYAKLVKEGYITRRDAIDFYKSKVNWNFGNAVTDIDIAIGDINEGI